MKGKTWTKQHIKQLKECVIKHNGDILTASEEMATILNRTAAACKAMYYAATKKERPVIKRGKKVTESLTLEASIKICETLLLFLKELKSKFS